MNELTFQEFEQLTQEMYTTHDSTRRNSISNMLPQEIQNEQQIQFFLRLFQQCNNSYALQYLISLFTSSIKKHPSTFLIYSSQIQVVILDIVNTKNIPSFIYRSIFSLFAISVVSSWNDVNAQCQFVTTIKELLARNQMKTSIIAIYLIFYVLDDSRSIFSRLAFSKSTVSSIKEKVVYELMVILIGIIKETTPMKENEELLQKQYHQLILVLFLCHAWHYEEDDPSWIHLPKTFYYLVDDVTFFQHLFQCYEFYQTTTTSTTILELLFVTSSLRRLNTLSEQRKYTVLEAMKTFLKYIIENDIGLSTSDNTVFLCRLLTKFRTNQLSTANTEYEWIVPIEQFTEIIFKGTNLPCINSMLGFWFKYAVSLYRYNDKLEQWKPLLKSLVSVFIKSTLQNVITYFNTDPTEDPILITDQLIHLYETFGPIARCVYSSFIIEIESYLNELTQQFSKYYTTTCIEKDIISSQIAWIMEMIIAALQAKMTTATDTTSCRNDSKLSTLGIQFVVLYNSYIKSNPNIQYITQFESSGDYRLQISCIHFMNIFRRTVVTETNIQFLNSMGIEKMTTTDDFLHFYIDMVSTILASWKQCTIIITKCLELFEIISNSSLFSYQLFKFDIVQHMVTESHTNLLCHINAPVKDLKHLHYQLYKTLGTLLFNCRMAPKLQPFLHLFMPTITTIKSLLDSNPMQLQSNPLTVYLLFIDLSAIIKSTENTHTVHLPLYDFLILHIFPLLNPLLQLFKSNNQVCIAMIKFCLNISSTKNFKENFPNESPSCMVIFKTISLSISLYCQLFLTTTMNDSTNPYLSYYKPLCLCLQTMSQCFQCKSICFSILEMYNDTTLIDIFTSTLKIALQIPFYSLEEYPKIVTTVYTYIESLGLVIQSSLNIFRIEDIQSILELIQKGLYMKSPLVIIHCSNFIETLLSTYYSKMLQKKYLSSSLSNVLSMCKESLIKILWICFDNLFNDFDVWTLTAPILLIFLLIPDVC